MNISHVVTTTALTMTLLSGNVIADENHYEYVVIGAEAGLSATYRLEERNRTYIILEKEKRSAGIAENEVRGRFHYAYPAFNKGYFTRLHTLKSSLVGVYLARDYMAYPTFDAAFESGYKAVQQAEKKPAITMLSHPDFVRTYAKQQA